MAATAFKQNILFPVGRLVAGSVHEAKTKDHQGNPLVIKRGADAGKPTQRFDFAVAFTKMGETHWGYTEWGKIIWAVGHQCFPKGQADQPTFAWKIIDGDSTVMNGKEKRPCDQPGYAGHWVIWFSSSYPPSLRNADGTRELTDAEEIKRGNCVQVYGNVDGNEDTQKPGVYINHNAVAFSGNHVDGEITGGQDYSNVGFGSTPAPAFVTSMPTAGMTLPPPVPGAAALPPALPPPPAASPSAPVAPAVSVQPHSGFMTPPAVGAAPPPPAAPSAPAPPPPPAPPVATGPVMTPKAGGAPYASFIANGWTDAAMRDAGYLV